MVTNEVWGNPDDVLVYAGFIDGNDSMPAQPSGLTINLQAADDEYLCAENNGGYSVSANRGQAGTWETFVLLDLNGGSLADGDPVAIRSSVGRYFRAYDGGGGQLGVIGEHPYSHETFTLLTRNHTGGAVVSGDTISPESVLNYFVSADSGGGAGTNVAAGSAGAPETFRITIH